MPKITKSHFNPAVLPTMYDTHVVQQSKHMHTYYERPRQGVVATCLIAICLQQHANVGMGGRVRAG